MLLKKRFCKPCYQSIRSKEFEIYDEKSWENINEYKIRNIKDKHVAVFTYTSFWIIYYVIMHMHVNEKKDISNQYVHCKQIENVFWRWQFKNIWNDVQ